MFSLDLFAVKIFRLDKVGGSSVLLNYSTILSKNWTGLTAGAPICKRNTPSSRAQYW